MNNQPPIRELLSPSLIDRESNFLWPTSWANWFQQVFACLRGITKTMNVTGTVDFGSIPGHSQLTSVVTVTGARIGDGVIVSPTSDVAGVFFVGVVTANDTVSVCAKNFTAGAIDPASQSFRIIVIQN